MQQPADVNQMKPEELVLLEAQLLSDLAIERLKKSHGAFHHP